ncbi:hypothetical protein E2C01_028879 [Portunus trituberculatus]|uniref:Uncharacterized protein n=1 Tax=Portunus trituberculatus TaxID=210409 RepID=A0A5B7EQF3_PORTR|nr:hypothetical protein [Portunus trituberculatus]
MAARIMMSLHYGCPALTERGRRPEAVPRPRQARPPHFGYVGRGCFQSQRAVVGQKQYMGLLDG